MANVESEANLAVCVLGRKNEERGEKAQISAKVAGLMWHSCLWSAVVMKAKKKRWIFLRV